MSSIPYETDVKYSGMQRNAYFVACFWLHLATLPESQKEFKVASIIAKFYGEGFVEYIPPPSPRAPMATPKKK